MGFAVVLAGGDVPERRLVAGTETATLVVAADGGVRIARSLGLPIHAVVGDLDSASEGDLAWARAEGADVIEFPTDKAHTDLELAFQHAEGAPDIDRIVVLGVEGGRLDHEFGNWAVCCGKWGVGVDVVTDRGIVHVLRGDGCNTVALEGTAGDVVSILPRLGSAVGVTTEGLRWELDDAVLYAEQSRGVSNEFLAEAATISIRSGALLVVRPGATGW